MTTTIRAAIALATLGIALGVLLAVVGLPYGRINSSAFAELYHGPTDTTGTIHVAIDCFPQTAPTDSSCTVFDPFYPLSISVTLGNSTGQAVALGAFGFTVRTDETMLVPLVVNDSDPYVNANPDMDDGAFDLAWSCAFPPPSADTNLDSAVADSWLGCFSPAFLGPLVPDGAQHFKLATVTYDYVGPQFGSNSVDLALLDVSVFDESFAELGSCRPIINTESPCFDASLNVVGPHGPDFDNDGVLNSDDNCPFYSNSSQANNDRNFISNSPIFSQNDLTRAHSDILGDACDSDNDNDGSADLNEVTTACGGPTNRFVSDTDGDRFLDGVECTLATQPTDPNSKPAVTACGLATDADNDGLSNRIEYCFYNTNPNVADTDGDGVKDGCEAASFNGDTIVNVADLGMLASEISRPVPPSQKLVNLDVNKDGAYNPADLGMVAARVGKCP